MKLGLYQKKDNKKLKHEYTVNLNVFIWIN